MSNIKVMCINDSNIPDIIPPSHRIKKGNWYTVIHTYKMANQDNMLGFVVKEADLLPLNLPYECWQADRFGINIDDLPALEELRLQCGELDDVDLSELLVEIEEPKEVELV